MDIKKDKKTCCRCRQILSISEFGPRILSKDGLQSLCKECNSKQSLDYYHKKKLSKIYSDRSSERKSKIRKVLSLIKSLAGCFFCGENAHFCLDFHHIDQNDKEIVLSNQAYSLNKLISEIQKCEIVCANCHRKIHAEVLEIKERRNYSIDLLVNLKNNMKKGKQKKEEIT